MAVCICTVGRDNMAWTGNLAKRMINLRADLWLNW